MLLNLQTTYVVYMIMLLGNAHAVCMSQAKKQQNQET